MGWRHVEQGEPMELRVDASESVYRALAYWPEFEGPGMELFVSAADRTQARERVVEKLRELDVGVSHPPLVQVLDLDDELRSL